MVNFDKISKSLQNLYNDDNNFLCMLNQCRNRGLSHKDSLEAIVLIQANIIRLYEAQDFAKRVDSTILKIKEESK